MHEPLNLVVGEEKPQRGGFSVAVGVSLVFHAAFIILFLLSYRPVQQEPNAPMMRYVELIKQQPKEFVEAPGPKVDAAPLNAPYSDANRRASMPKPTGDKPTTRPGAGDTIYTPAMRSGPQQQAQQQSAAAPPSAKPSDRPATAVDASTATSLSSRIPPLRTQAAATAGVNWRSVVSDVRQIASIGGDDALERAASGGEEGTADTGQLSFETQWYDWGEYAQSMVSKIRVHWYENMPMLIRTGLRGVVTIRFTIQRDGSITDIEMLNSSGAPPYDFAARKAIELASPLKPLPADFPNKSERVTAMFYYNQAVPRR